MVSKTGEGQRLRCRHFGRPPLLISVALCTHNGARYLGEQIRSICAQSVAPCEIVLSDDASADGSVHLVRKTLEDFHAGRTDPAIELRVFENRPALGVTRNFEQ